MADPTSSSTAKPFHLESSYNASDAQSETAALEATLKKADAALAQDPSFADAVVRNNAINEFITKDEDSVNFDYTPGTFQATYRRFADHIREGRALTDSESKDYLARGHVALRDAEAAAQAFKVDFTLLTTEMTKVYHEFERNGIDGEALDPILTGIFLGTLGLGASIVGQMVTDLPLKAYALHKESFRKWYIQNEAWKAIKKDPSMLACLKEGGADIPASKFHGMQMPNLMSKGTTKAMLVLSGFLAGIVGLFEAYDRYFLNSDDGDDSVGAASQESSQTDQGEEVSAEDLEGLAEAEPGQRSIDEVSVDVGIALGSREQQALVMTILIERSTSVEKIQHEILSGKINNAKQTYDHYVDFVNAQCSAYNSVNSFTTDSSGYVDPEQFTEKKMGELIDKLLAQTGMGRWVDRHEQLAMVGLVAIPLMFAGTLGSSEYVMDLTTSILEGVGMKVQDAEFKQQVEADIESRKLEIMGPYLECVDEKELERVAEKAAKEAEVRAKYKKPVPVAAGAPVPVPVPEAADEEDAADPVAPPLVAFNAVPGAQSVLSSAATLVSKTGAGLKPAPMGELILQSASNYAGGTGVPDTNASFRVANADAAAPPGWVRLPGGGAVPASDASISGRGNPAPTSAKPKPSAPVKTPVTARGVAGTAAGVLVTTAVVAGAEIYLDEKLDELGVPEKNQDALFDTTNAGLLGYTIYANPVVVGGLPLAYLGSDFAATETRPLVEEYVPEPMQDTVTEVAGVVGGGTGLVTGMGLTYTVGVAAGGVTLLEIAALGAPPVALAGAIGYALYQDYKLYRHLKETREYFLTQAPEAEREAFVDLCYVIETGLQGDLTYEKMQSIRDMISKEPYQSFLDANGQYFVDAYLDPFISEYTAIPHVAPFMLLPVLLASDAPSTPSSKPHRDYSLDLGLIRDEILRPYADEAYAELYPYTDSVTGLPLAAKKSDTTLVSVGAGLPRPSGQTTFTQKPYTTDSAEPRLIYDLTKRGDAIYDGLVKQYPFDEPNLLFKVSEQCKTFHANERYTITAQILSRWLQDAQKYLSNEQTSLAGAFKNTTGFSTGIIDEDEALQLTTDQIWPLEEQIAQYAHGDIADINEVLEKTNELRDKMIEAMGWDLWKDLL